jgi:hypothetical protein
MSPSSLLPTHEKRRHPRATLETRVHLTAGPDGRAFQATLRSVDVSLGGIFFQSEFALKIGSELHASFELPDEKRRVEADGVVVRVEQYDPRKRGGRTGFALQFTAFEGDGLVALASIFLAPRLREFSRRWLSGRGRSRRGDSELERLVDALIAWELERTEDEGEPVAARPARR